MSAAPERLRALAERVARIESDWILAQAADVSAGALRRAEAAVDSARDDWRDIVTPEVLLDLLDELAKARATIDRQAETSRLDTEQVGRLIALLREARPILEDVLHGSVPRDIAVAPLVAAVDAELGR